MKVYEGMIDPEAVGPDIPPHIAASAEHIVFVDGQVLSLEAIRELGWNVEAGISWGYYGNGPKQTATAILLDYFEGDVERTEQLYNQFMETIVAAWPINGGWRMTGSEIQKFVDEWEPLVKRRNNWRRN